MLSELLKTFFTPITTGRKDTTMVYNYENCTFFPECIAISTDAAVFNVDIYHHPIDCTEYSKIGKANVIVSRSPVITDKPHNIAFIIFNGEIDNSSKLQECIVQGCVIRCKAI